MNIYHGDCLDFIPTLAPNSIDCVLMDPPYFLDTMDNNWEPDEHSKRKPNSHIKKLPHGMKFDICQGQKFQEFMKETSQALFKVLKPGGFILCFSSPRMYHNAASAIESSGFEIRDQIVWTYNISQVKAFKQDHIIANDTKMTDEEKKKLIEMLKNHKTPQLKPMFESLCVGMKPIEGRFIDNMKKWGTGLIYTPFGVPTNVMHFNKPNKEERKNNSHPTVKPIALIEKLLEIFCPAGGIVLDPFLGSGTTLVAANKLGRVCIGCEINEEYLNIILERLK